MSPRIHNIACLDLWVYYWLCIQDTESLGTCVVFFRILPLSRTGKMVIYIIYGMLLELVITFAGPISQVQ